MGEKDRESRKKDENNGVSKEYLENRLNAQWERISNRLDRMKDYIKNIEEHMATRKDIVKVEKRIEEVRTDIEKRIEKVRGEVRGVSGEVSQMSERITDLRYVSIGAIIVLAFTVVLKVFAII